MKQLITALVILLAATVAGLVFGHADPVEPPFVKPNAALLHQSIKYGLTIEGESDIIYHVKSVDGSPYTCTGEPSTLNYKCLITALSGNQYLATIEIEEIEGYRIATPATMEALDNATD